MNFTQKSQERLKNISVAISRFWFSTGAFLLATLTIMIETERDKSWEEQIVSLLLAGFLGILVQLIYEHLLKNKQIIQWLLYAITLIFTFGYYRYLIQVEIYDYTANMRTAVLFFILLFAIIWVPAIRQDEYAFSRNFIVYIKGFFTSFLFSLVLFIGLMAVISAFDFLITSIDSNIYIHLSALIWCGFFPIYFLSLLPDFPTKKATVNDNYLSATTIPKFFEILLSYIVIPIILIYTLILLLYILQNITGEFWNNSLLDPLLISYVIVGWLTLFAIDTLNNKVATLFKKYFPPLLFIVTTFQGIATLNKINHLGLTDGRYFILLFVLFSVVSSLIYLFFHQRMIFIPALLIGLAILSIFPLIDAVSIATKSQSKQLESTLTNNHMLANQAIIPDSTISDSQKKKIIESYNYLNKVDQLDHLDFLPKDYLDEIKFEETFGFSPYTLEENNYHSPKSFSVSADVDNLQLTIENQDLLFSLYTNQGKFQPNNSDTFSFNYKSQTYQLAWKENTNKNQLALVLEDSQGRELANYDLRFLRELEEFNYSYESIPKTLDELTFTQEFDQVRLTLCVTNLYVEELQDVATDFYLMIHFN